MVSVSLPCSHGARRPRFKYRGAYAGDRHSRFISGRWYSVIHCCTPPSSQPFNPLFFTFPITDVITLQYICSWYISPMNADQDFLCGQGASLPSPLHLVARARSQLLNGILPSAHRQCLPQSSLDTCTSLLPLTPSPHHTHAELLVSMLDGPHCSVAWCPCLQIAHPRAFSFWCSSTLPHVYAS